MRSVLLPVALQAAAFLQRVNGEIPYSRVFTPRCYEALGICQRACNYCWSSQTPQDFADCIAYQGVPKCEYRADVLAILEGGLRSCTSMGGRSLAVDFEPRVAVRQPYGRIEEIYIKFAFEHLPTSCREEVARWYSTGVKINFDDSITTCEFNQTPGDEVPIIMQAGGDSLYFAVGQIPDVHDMMTRVGSEARYPDLGALRPFRFSARVPEECISEYLHPLTGLGTENVVTAKMLWDMRDYTAFQKVPLK